MSKKLKAGLRTQEGTSHTTINIIPVRSLSVEIVFLAGEHKLATCL